jgi:hypothetical protein
MTWRPSERLDYIFKMLAILALVITAVILLRLQLSSPLS